MIESELFALLENTADAAYTVTRDGDIRSWNRAAERLFGYTAAEVVGREVVEVLDARDVLGTAALSKGADAATRRWDPNTGGIANFDLNVQVKAGDRIWINVSTIFFPNPRTGKHLFVRLARDVTVRHRQQAMLGRMQQLGRELATLTSEPFDHAPVEALSDQERRILKLLASGASTAAVSRQLRISPQTLRNHLHHINGKLRTHNRLEAVTHAQRRGLID
jgi:PAS domain S-box-containing protein